MLHSAAPILAVSFAVALLELAPASSAVAETYNVTELTPLSGYANSFATDVSNLGEVIGYSTNGYPGNSNGPSGGPSFDNAVSIATVWNSRNPNTPTELPPLPGYQSSYALGINDFGLVVGYSIGSLGNGTQVATIWKGTTPSALAALPGGTFSEASSINDFGVVAGTTWIGGVGNATVWKGNIATALPGGSGQGLGINELGGVAGYSGISNANATVWNRAIPTNLGTLPNGLVSLAFGINDEGIAVGYSYCGETRYCAVLWHGAMKTNLGASFSGDSEALAINNSGQAVGWGNEPQSEAIVWNDRRPTALGFLPGDSTGEATGINIFGQIVGYSGNIDEGTYNYDATLWNPAIAVPEASSWDMMVLGFVGLALPGYVKTRRQRGVHSRSPVRRSGQLP